MFPHKFWRPFLNCVPQLFFRPQYVWFPVFQYICWVLWSQTLPNSSGQLAEHIVYIIPPEKICIVTKSYCNDLCNWLWHQHYVNRASDTQSWCVRIVFLIIIYGFSILCKKLSNICIVMTNTLCTHLSVILVFISLVASQLGA